MYLTVEKVVRRRRELVWQVLTDVASLGAWVEGLAEAEILGNEDPDVDARLRVTRRGRADREVHTCEITAWRPPEMLALEAHTERRSVFGRITLEAVPEGTALGVYVEIGKGGGLASFFKPAYGLMWAPSNEPPAAQAIYERSVAALVARIEAHGERPFR